MNSHEIEQNVKHIFENFRREEFIFDLLLAYGISKTSITRLKKGDFNLSKISGEILYKKKIFFKEEAGGKLLSTIESAAKDKLIQRNSPRFAIVTDYKTLVARDLKLNQNLDIEIEKLPNHFTFFLPLAGSEVYHSANDNEADRNAAYKMASLYDELVTHNKDIYNSKEHVHGLNIFLSRLLFCYFAEDTEIFETESVFTDTLAQHTAEDGSDTHLVLDKIFERLNTKSDAGFADYLIKFPYVNGGLFGKKIQTPVFTRKARRILVELGDLNWKEINPDIFGSMIQAVVMPEYRSDLGMHYTSVPNILKLIRPLFLDELYEAFDTSTGSVSKLRKLIRRIAAMKFFDPACGSGNFLIIIYKEIRRLEVEILKEIIELEGDFLFAHTEIRLSQFYGIEIDDFAHEVAILSLWLAEHQMNQYFEHQLEGYTAHQSIIPLKPSGTIVEGNAARIDWETVCPIVGNEEVYVVGNPPYLGARMQDEHQKDDMDLVFHSFTKYRDLDYISIWFFKAKKFIEGRNAKSAFVSTNSVCQGQQVALLWTKILDENTEIGFAYLSFKWTNNAKGNAGVTVIILGLRNKSSDAKYLFDNNVRREVKNINAYLLDGPDVIISERNTPISKFPKMNFGNMPNDGGGLILSEEERNKLINENPETSKYVRLLLGSSEYIKGNKRYCLWIEDDELNEAERIPFIQKRIEITRKHRLKSRDKGTNELAKRSHQFRDRNTANDSQLIIPAVSSERRDYIPCGYLGKDVIVLNSSLVIYDAEPYLFAIVNSKMHMVWVNAVGGKLETRYRYSAKLCYNTFPFPDITTRQKETLNLYVYAVLDERAKHPEKTMAQLYDPDTMPAGLRQAHHELDEAVERCYRLQPFTSDTERLEYLFKMYETMVNDKLLMVKGKDLFAKKKKRRRKKK